MEFFLIENTKKFNLKKKLLTSTEKEICQKKLKIQYELLEKMLDNYCNLIQLQSVNRQKFNIIYNYLKNIFCLV